MTTAALDAIECLPAMEKLDTEPNIEKFSKAIDSLVFKKVPGSDEIPPNLIKHCKTNLVLPKSSASAGKKGPCHRT